MTDITPENRSAEINRMALTFMAFRGMTFSEGLAEAERRMTETERATVSGQQSPNELPSGTSEENTP